MRLPTHAGRAVVAALLLAGFLGLLHELDRRGLAPTLLAGPPGPARLIACAAVVAAALACALAAPRRRRAILLAGSLIAAPAVLGAWAVVLVGYAAGVIALARAAIPLAARIAIAVAAWLAVPLARLVWLDGATQADTIPLALVWAGQLYAAIFVVVERERERPELRTGVVTDAFYLLAPPRLVVPFFQPIAARRLARSQRGELPPRLLWRGAGLAAYAAGVAVIASTLGPRIDDIAWPPLAVAARFCELYARLTYTIFAAVAVFRLLGYELPSGFRAPFLSRSFAEFFRRFNYYVRDAVLSLFYFPLLGRLRHNRSPRAASIAAAYLAIAAGSFLLHDLLVPLALTVEPAAAAGYYLDPVRVLAFVVLWTLIIVPTAGIAPTRSAPASRARTILAVLGFNAVYLALWYAQDVGRGLW